jgi:hypothetical protein
MLECMGKPEDIAQRRFAASAVGAGGLESVIWCPVSRQTTEAATTELVLRFAGGMQALIGLGWAAIALGGLGETDGTPSDAVGWAAFVLGAACVVLMVVAGLRIALGEQPSTGRGIGLLGGTLVAGLAGALMMAAAAAS